jgi:hypothetical protein
MIVSNSSCLIILIRLEKLDLLQKMAISETLKSKKHIKSSEYRV